MNRTALRIITAIDVNEQKRTDAIAKLRWLSDRFAKFARTVTSGHAPGRVDTSDVWQLLGEVEAGDAMLKEMIKIVEHTDAEAFRLINKHIETAGHDVCENCEEQTVSEPGDTLCEFCYKEYEAQCEADDL